MYFFKKITLCTLCMYSISRVYLFFYLWIFTSFQVFSFEGLLFLFKVQYELDAQRLFSSLILAPFYETLIFYVLLLRAIRFFKGSDHLAILIITLLFGLIHYPTGGFFLVGGSAIDGCLMACLYIRVFKEKNETAAALSVMACHAIYNGLNMVGPA